MENLSKEIIDKAIEYGALLAGVVNVEDLKKSPSHTIVGKMPPFEGEGTKEAEGRKRLEVTWPEGMKTAIVLAGDHPDDQPQLDWWVRGGKGGTKGNLIMMRIVSKLVKWLEDTKGIKSEKLPYFIEHGAVFMKDTAVLGGLGCIGKNNILVTRDHGPCLRLRVFMIDYELPSTGAIDFDPCADCKEYCRKVCPQNAFGEKTYSPEEYGQKELPGRNGVFDRIKCNYQMEIDNANLEEVQIKGQAEPTIRVKYCRKCELACPVGRKKS